MLAISVPQAKTDRQNELPELTQSSLLLQVVAVLLSSAKMVYR